MFVKARCNHTDSEQWLKHIVANPTSSQKSYEFTEIIRAHRSYASSQKSYEKEKETESEQEKGKGGEKGNEKEQGKGHAKEKGKG